MKVRELIEELQKCNPEYDVVMNIMEPYDEGAARLSEPADVVTEDVDKKIVELD